jgi:hypothetical protein
MFRVILGPDGDLWSPPIWADIQGLDKHGRVRLDRPETIRDLDNQHISLTDEFTLVVFDHDGDDQNRVDDLIAVGVTLYDVEGGRWVLKGWDTAHFSDLSETEKRPYLSYRADNGRDLKS